MCKIIGRSIRLEVLVRAVREKEGTISGKILSCDPVANFEVGKNFGGFDNRYFSFYIIDEFDFRHISFEEVVDFFKNKGSK